MRVSGIWYSPEGPQEIVLDVCSVNDHTSDAFVCFEIEIDEDEHDDLGPNVIFHFHMEQKDALELGKALLRIEEMEGMKGKYGRPTIVK